MGSTGEILPFIGLAISDIFPEGKWVYSYVGQG